ncbi:hypothetical protein AN641_00955 [Candidatus Epulonipiscioides gigas]|nr:hypothetical protein AN641_00955 [Epulopiscium sp. SCG-C07WGA-EpuloA2]
MYGINEQVYIKLQEYFEYTSGIEQVILYGSRAKGTHFYSSDIDICVTYTGKNKFDVINTLEDIVGVYSIDIVFADKLNQNLKQQIDKYGITIYKNITLS